MSNKEIVIDLVHRLPDDASLQEIAREIEFVAAVREGFSQLDRGEGRPIEEVREDGVLMGYQVILSPRSIRDLLPAN